MSSFLLKSNIDASKYSYLCHYNSGWTAKLKPENHPLCNYEFDFLVGAGGKQSKLKGFMKKPSDRTGKAIAITFNLVNEEKEADRKVCFHFSFCLLK